VHACAAFVAALALSLLLFPPTAMAQRRQVELQASAANGAGMYDHETMAPVIVATPLSGSIRIDGVLNEAVWRAAEPYSDFIQRDPEEGEPASERTEVRILVGPDALYIGGRFFDRDPDGIRATLVRRDVVSDFDFAMVSLDSRHDHNTGYAFTLTPSGAFQDAALGADGQYDFGWDPVWEGAATVDGEGWSAEWKIPFNQLRFESAQEAEWGIQVTRSIARKQETASFAFVPRSERGGPHRFGHLRGLGQVRAPDRVELLPYATTRSEHLNVAPGDPFRGASEQFHGVGLDLKYGLTSQLTLDATVNPDFGQVEVDPAVVNLTQYETFFPERRPFFTEGSEIFRFGGQGEMGGSLFYSRRIGRAPQGDLSRFGASYVDVPSQTTIAGAAKISGRLGQDWSVGVLEAATLEEGGRYMTPDGAEGSAAVEPLSNYFVGRARKDFRNGNSTIGGILTAVNRDLSDESLRSLLHSGAYVVGLDFNHLWKNREWFVAGALVGSRVEGSTEAILRTQGSSVHNWQRPDAGHVAIDPTRTSLQGWRGSVSAGRQAGDHWLGSVRFQARSPGFEPNDLGFETSVDNLGFNGDIQYRNMVPGERTRSYRFSFGPSLNWNFDGDLLGAQALLQAMQQWSNFWVTSTYVMLNAETDNDQATRGGPVARTPAGVNFGQFISTDQRKSYSFTLNLGGSRGSGRGGWDYRLGGGVTFHPTSAVEVGMEPFFRRNHALAQYVAAIPDELATRTYGSRYVFSDLDERTFSLDTRVSWTFTPRMSLQLFVQPFISSAGFSRFKELHQPREWDWDVYGEEIGSIREEDGMMVVDPDGDGQAASFAFPRPDFNVRSLRGNAVLRWEYRPGSTLYLVWQQRRFGYEPDGGFSLREDTDALFRVPPENVFALKINYWLGR
jgi:hypothetical protein